MKSLIVYLFTLFACTMTVSAQDGNTYRLPQTYLCADESFTYAGEAAALADMHMMEAQYDLRWWDTSPSCRYALLSFQTPEGGENHRLFVVWDLQTGARRFEYVRVHDYYELPLWNWNADESEVVIGGFWKSVFIHDSRAFGDSHLFNLNTGQVVELHCEPASQCIRDVNLGFRWDNQRNWLWSSGTNGVIAYDRSTGAAIFSFFAPPWGGNGGLLDYRGFFFSPDGTYMVVNYGSNAYASSGVTIWDIDHRIAYPINMEGYVREIAISPDNRYFAAGDNVIRVWDLQNLPPAYEDRLPTYRHPASDARISWLEFADNTTIRTWNHLRGWQCWDVVTGARLTCPS